MKQQHASLVELYESNWMSMSGLQMAPKAAVAGYQMVKSLPKGMALDIGCGDGTNALQLQKIGFRVEGCDISANAVRKAQAKGIAAKKVDLNRDKLPFESERYKLVWLTDVIEHVFWPETLIAESYRVLQKEGYLYLTTPNVIWWGIRLQIVLGKTLKELHPEHIHWFNFRTLSALLKKEKFILEKSSGYNCFVPHPLAYKLPFLNTCNKIGSLHNLTTYTLIVLAKK